MVRDIVGPEFLSKGPAWIAVCLFLSALTEDILNSAQLLNIQYLRIARADITSTFLLMFFFSRAIFLQMKCNSNLQAPGLINPISTWNFAPVAVAND